MIRAKFKVRSIEINEEAKSKQILFDACIDGEENKSFAEATPAGMIQLTVTNPDCLFEEGEYFVDFTKVEPSDTNPDQQGN